MAERERTGEPPCPAELPGARTHTHSLGFTNNSYLTTHPSLEIFSFSVASTKHSGNRTRIFRVIQHLN